MTTQATETWTSYEIFETEIQAAAERLYGERLRTWMNADLREDLFGECLDQARAEATR